MLRSSSRLLGAAARASAPLARPVPALARHALPALVSALPASRRCKTYGASPAVDRDPMTGEVISLPDIDVSRVLVG